MKTVGRSIPARLFLCSLLGLMLVPYGCAKDYGRLNRDASLTASFQENRFQRDYRFYYVGRENQPYAIVGIRNGYEFRSKFWTMVDPSSETFQQMVNHPWGFQEYPPYGAYILDSAGNRVGIWYSSYDFTTIRVTDDKGVYVHNPYSPTDDGNDPRLH